MTELLTDLGRAVDLLRAGRLVAFPTETVYGLGARAADPVAVAGIFVAKGRPQDNPLIVHVADGVEGVVAGWPAVARDLAEAFWPGPLTIVAARDPGFPDAVSAGRSTVAVRCPDHPVALELIRGAGPLAAPSANRSGTPSPTTAQHVLDDLSGRIAAVVDGGPCLHGLESTVVDVTGARPLVLRPGALDVEALEAVVGAVDVHPSVDRPSEVTDARAPGMKYRHYSPAADVWLVEGPPARVRELLDGPDVYGVFVGEARSPQERAFPDVASLARALYAVLRELDALGATRIVVGGVPADGLGRALRNRLRKAASRVLVTPP
ncbi:MAG: threonylcarbamoyl-AMP synthase [Alphaproteobacteria bacterium]|nr:threonylcarbamoyl-AMP synthase [Alphaproteobacteria bacterium]